MGLLGKESDRRKTPTMFWRRRERERERERRIMRRRDGFECVLKW